MHLSARLPFRLPSLDARTRRLLGVGAASYLGRLGAALVLLVTVPLARQTLDAELFGVWMMLSALLGFFAFADLGIGNGLLNRITAAHASGRRDAVVREMVGGYICTGVIALAILLAWALGLALGADPAGLVGTTAPQHHGAVRSAINAFVILLAINLPASLIQKIQLGAQEGQWVGVAQFIASIATLLAIPAALLLGGGLVALVLASLGMQVLVNIGSTLWWLRRHGSLRLLRPAQADRQVIAALLRSGGLFFALQLAVALAFQSDAIVISQVLGPAAYGDFSVVQRLFLLISAVLGAGLTGLWPAFGDAFARGDLRWARQALWRWLVLAGIGATLACAALMLSVGWISLRWFHLATPPTLALSAALAAWTIVEALGAVIGACMNGANQLRAQLVFALGMAALAFAGKWRAILPYGMPGVVLATLCAYLAVSVPGQIFILRRMFSERKASP